VKDGDWIKLPDEGNLSYSDKPFSGWNTSSSGAGIYYSPGDFLDVNTDITLYAQWVEFTIAPTGLSTSYGDGPYFEGIILTWDAVEGFTDLKDPYYTYMWEGRKFVTYVVLRRYNFSDDFEPHAFSSSSSYRDTRIDMWEGGTYEYIIALGVVTVRIGSNGYDYDVILGPHSDVSSPMPIYADGEDMPAPTGVRAIWISPSVIRISWKAVPRARGYRVYSSWDGGPFERVQYSLITTNSITEVVDPGTTVRYTVSAVNRGYEEGPLSAIVQAVIPSEMRSYTLNLKNNYSYAIAAGYVRMTGDVDWGQNLLGSALVTNATQVLGTFEQGPYEIKATSLAYYRVAVGRTDGVDGNSITITGGVTSGYRTVYYSIDTDLTEDATVTALSTGWSIVLPE
jgi:hypothetical protein